MTQPRNDRGCHPCPGDTPAVRPFLALMLVALAASAAHASAAVPSPARLQVTADEFRLALSRPSIRRGPAVIELVNLGEDDHDLALRRQVPGARTRRIPIVAPSAVRALETTLPAGRYILWCTVAGHRALGMRATLVVRRS